MCGAAQDKRQRVGGYNGAMELETQGVISGEVSEQRHHLRMVSEGKYGYGDTEYERPARIRQLGRAVEINQNGMLVINAMMYLLVAGAAEA